MTPTTRRLTAGLIFTAAGLCVACQPAAVVPDPGSDPTTTTTVAVPETTTTTVAPAPPPQPLVVADSITWTVIMSGRFPAEWRGVTMMGWSMRTAEIQAALTAAVTDGTRQVVVALGTNDASPLPPPYGGGGGDGWSQTDADVWTSLLDALPADTGLVLVSPWLTGSPVDGHEAEIDEARAFIDSYAASRPGTVVVDWRPVVEAGPVLDVDGIHLARVTPDSAIPVTDYAAAARVGVIADGLAALG